MRCHDTVFDNQAAAWSILSVQASRDRPVNTTLIVLRMNHILSFLFLAFMLTSGAYSQYAVIAHEEEFLGPRIAALTILKPIDPDFHFSQETKWTDTLILKGPIVKTPGDNNDPNKLKVQKVARAQAQIWFKSNVDCMNLVGFSYTLSNLLSQAPLRSHKLFAVRVSEVLSDPALEITKRMYCLYILQVLLEYVPSRKLDFLRTNIRSGAVSRAGLELSLTKGFDLASEAHKIRKKGMNRMDPMLFEAFQRVELLERIQMRYRQTGASQPSKTLMKLHDDLLLASCPLGELEIVSLTDNCIRHMIENDVSEEDKQTTYELMTHSFQNSDISRKTLKARIATNNATKELYDEMYKWMKTRREISLYLSLNRVDPYITNLLLPFLGTPLPTLEHYKYIFLSFEAHTQAEVKLEKHLQTIAEKRVTRLRGMQGQLQDMELETGHAHHIGEVSTIEQTTLERELEQADQEDREFDLQQYIPQRIDSSTYKKYQRFVLKILNMASPHIKGAKAYLKQSRNCSGRTPSLSIVILDPFISIGIRDQDLQFIFKNHLARAELKTDSLQI
ncbi:uncharacterized protein MELLADRAFT_64716 [Melampsora larici-populina 98AG31]|uniref:Uncharacterized protein n=1 Tax=Melampsora larici-populina (strain 98AG31 / pathotype 3-4-7) TaxID=747676 RepID=F4RSI2_MELLP|nr:uncharacterized protein MELLADRAFT_64716 [Melampsora larici-populina 98AG31]EGG04690.1 hypothetical protein MELLADRAFT_64716 [Melampsora larici-populina 98AG31]